VSDPLLTIEQAAEIVQLSPRQLYRAAREGRAPFFKPENRWRIYESELHAWVRSHAPRQRATAATVDAMPLPRRRGSSFREKVIPLDARRAS
jgi:excisionase family DNA binding protein